MKKFIFSMIFVMAAWIGASAMSFERAQREALYLTDKMAYELNLNDQQYNDAYEINLDYFLSVDSPSDLYGVYYNHRLVDLRCILHDWQYSLLMAADYFLRPIVWRAGSWFFPIYNYYNYGYYYYSRPRVWVSYYGGHSHAYHRDGFYAHRRPIWNGGLRGHDMRHPSHSVGSRSGGARPGGVHSGGSRPGSGRGYHIDINGHRGGNTNHSGGNNRGGNTNHGGENNHHNYGSTNHSGGGNHSQSMGSGGRSNSGSMNRGNSFDGSSSRRGGLYSSPSGSTHRESGNSNFGARGSSRGGSFSGSHSGGSRGGSFSGGHGGSSRGGRR